MCLGPKLPVNPTTAGTQQQSGGCCCVVVVVYCNAVRERACKMEERYTHITAVVVDADILLYRYRMIYSDI